jgi:hypothetical protein
MKNPLPMLKMDIASFGQYFKQRKKEPENIQNQQTLQKTIKQPPHI